jgi:hypothetical protein
MTKCIVPIVGILLILFLIGWVIHYSPVQVTSEYTTHISVDTPDKIENAISNVVYDLGRRDFVPVYMEVKWYPAVKAYEVYARGIDRTKLGKYEP